MSDTNVRLEHTRKDFKRMGRHPDMEDAITSAIQWTGMQFGSSKFLDKIDTPLTLCGKTAASVMQDTGSDDPILFLPVYMRFDEGREEPGCLITFPGRVLLAWTEGTFRLTYFAHLLHSATISNVYEHSGYLVSFDTDQRWSIQIDARAFNTADFMPPLINTLNGVTE